MIEFSGGRNCEAWTATWRKPGWDFHPASEATGDTNLSNNCISQIEMGLWSKSHKELFFSSFTN